MQSNGVIGTFMNECVNSHVTTKHSAIIKENIKPIYSDYFFNNGMQEKETITRNRYGWNFPALG